ncbi:hypothetical protein A6V39_04260 [Candidatus Mycoplasma haematobovis]|uniref:DNA 3'-5' helicase n=1 Tax=Candidatus Mycoplasma haematobovis TaxID=432608 RepID=A0A1A9QEI2_9MOLU|nr:hypothetical protein A6V39_04260 [Candidatus Mycoplasma haematobovis]
MFDEFQDIDPIQFRIISKLSQDNRNIFCVGDPDQAIYGFRNALPEAFQDFKNYFDDAEIVKLEINYRSTVQILDVANELINKKKNIFSKYLIPGSKEKNGEKVRHFITTNPEREIEEITNTILSLHKQKKVPFKKFAVLFRNWSYGRRVNEVLTQKRIPFFSEDLKRLWNREEIKDSLAYLNIAFEDDIYNANKSLLRVINKPARGFGAKFLEILTNEARELGRPLIKHIVSKEKVNSEQKCEDLCNILKTIRNIAKDKKRPLHNRVTRILRESGLISHFQKVDPLRVSNINTFLQLIFDQDLNDLEQIKERLRELTKYTADRDVVYLTTIHGAKGLEFDYVFVMHMDEGKIPSKFTLLEKEPNEFEQRINEERRLTYVAFTRAKKALFLSSAFGQAMISRFVKDVETKIFSIVDLFADPSDDMLDDQLSEEEMYSDEDLQRGSDLEEAKDLQDDDEDG